MTTITNTNKSIKGGNTMKFKVYPKTMIKGGYEDMLHAEDYFINPDLVLHKDLNLQIIFTTADGKPIPEGKYHTAWYHYGMDTLHNSKVTYFAAKCWIDEDPSYVNECIEHLVDVANGFLAFHPEWFATFRIDESYRFYF